MDKYLLLNGWKSKKEHSQQKENKEFDPFSDTKRKLSAHALRRTCGTLALWGGASLRQVQDLLGHRDPQTTTLYAHAQDRWRHNPAWAIRKAMGI